MPAPKTLIVNLPYERPARHWEQGRDGTVQLREGRRSAGYEIFGNAVLVGRDAGRSEAGHSHPGRRRRVERLCCKMATGAGETLVMAMIVCWQVQNALAYPKRNKDFLRGLLFVAPGRTLEPVFDEESPIGTTRAMRVWYATA
jgi:hypothetical protein